MRNKRMDSANLYLREAFIPDYWQSQIEVSPQNSKSEFTPVPKRVDLDAVFVVEDYRKVRTHNAYSHGNYFISLIHLYVIRSPSSDLKYVQATVKFYGVFRWQKVGGLCRADEALEVRSGYPDES